jgi:hypothetical protein
MDTKCSDGIGLLPSYVLIGNIRTVVRKMLKVKPARGMRYLPLGAFLPRLRPPHFEAGLFWRHVPRMYPPRGIAGRARIEVASPELAGDSKCLGVPLSPGLASRKIASFANRQSARTMARCLPDRTDAGRGYGCLSSKGGEGDFTGACSGSDKLVKGSGKIRP